VVIVLLLWPRQLPGGGRAALFDASVAGLAVGMFVGRMGCLRQGCCHGHPVDPGSGWAIALRDLLPRWEGLWRFHPLPLWLGLWALIVAVIVSRVRRHLRPGNTLLAFIGLYSLGRIPLEFLRWQPSGAPAISPAQWESLGLVLATLGLLLLRQQWIRVRSTSRVLAAPGR